MRPYSEQILLALNKHGRLNCRQLAGHISHDFAKTMAIVNYMRQNKKVKTNGTIDDLAAYSLAEKGAAEAKRLTEIDPATQTHVHHSLVNQPIEAPAGASTVKVANTPRRRRSSSPNSLDDLAHESLSLTNARPFRTEEATAPSPHLIAMDPNAPVYARFGVLNTGELVIMPETHAIIVLKAEVTQALRAELSKAPA